MSTQLLAISMSCDEVQNRQSLSEKILPEAIRPCRSSSILRLGIAAPSSFNAAAKMSTSMPGLIPTHAASYFIMHMKMD